MTKTITIQGHSFEVSTPYEAGHQITEAEAKALNQTRCENIRNNCAKLVKEGVEKDMPMEQISAAVSEYDSKYVFTLAGVSTSVALDPVEKKALEIARKLLNAAIKEQGMTVKAVQESGQYDELLAEWAGNEDVVKEAQRQVSASKKLAAGTLKSLGLPSPAAE